MRGRERELPRLLFYLTHTPSTLLVSSGYVPLVSSGYALLTRSALARSSLATLSSLALVSLLTRLLPRSALAPHSRRVQENVRGKDVYLIQPTCPPVNENLVELFLMVSTMRRASARRITAVIPYYGYARQDRKMTSRVPISAADVARLLEAMGVDRVVAVDLHCGQIQGFFGPRVPVDNLDGGTVGVHYFGQKDLENPVIVSPDAGGVYRAKKFREGLKKHYKVDAGLAMIIKQRRKAGEIESMDLVGSVDGSDVVIVDDMIDTAGTLCKAANRYGQREEEKGRRARGGEEGRGAGGGGGNAMAVERVLKWCPRSVYCIVVTAML